MPSISINYGLVTPRAQDALGPVDRALAALGLERRTAATVPVFWMALEIVSRSDRVTTLPARFLANRPLADLVVRQPPVELDPIDIAMMWHPRTNRDRRSRWLRELVSDLVQS